MTPAEELLAYLTRKRLVSFEDGQFAIVTYPTCVPYCIDADDCKTPDQIIRWLTHLVPKTWWTKQHTRDFLSCTCGHNGIKQYPT